MSITKRPPTSVNNDRKIVEAPVHLTVVSQHFFPDLASTGQLLTELAVGMHKLGCSVFVLTARPSYTSEGQILRSDSIEGVVVRRLPSTHLDKNRAVGRIINGMTFFLSAFFALLSRPSNEVLFIVSNPPILPLIGLLLRRLRRQRFIYLVYDIYPDIAEKLGYLRADGFVSKLWKKMNRHVLRAASSVITPSESMKGVVSSHMGINGGSDQVRVIHNWVDSSFIVPISKDKNWFAGQHNLREKFVVLYAGNLGLSHDLETIITAAEHLREHNIRFVFIGEGGKKQNLMRLAKSKNLENVLFLPFQAREVLPYSVTCADVSIVALERGIEGLSMPSKLYTILASGRPVVALVDRDSDVAHIIAEAGCGVSINQYDVKGLVEAVTMYYRDPGMANLHGLNGRKYFEEHFTLDHATQLYLDVLQRTVEHRVEAKGKISSSDR